MAWSICHGMPQVFCRGAGCSEKNGRNTLYKARLMVPGGSVTSAAQFVLTESERNVYFYFLAPVQYCLD